MPSVLLEAADAALAIKSDAVVIPVRTFGTFECYNRKWKFHMPIQLAVKYGRPMHFEKLRAEAKVCDKARLKQIYQEVADEIMAEIAKLERKAD